MATIDQIKSVLYGTETGNRPSKVFAASCAVPDDILGKQFRGNYSGLSFGSNHWEQLLKEAYDAAVDKLSTLDRQQPTPEAALPLFEAAHRAWQAWAEVECEFQRALAKEGSDRFSIGTSCKVVMTARRVLHYRSSI